MNRECRAAYASKLASRPFARRAFGSRLGTIRKRLHPSTHLLSFHYFVFGIRGRSQSSGDRRLAILMSRQLRSQQPRSGLVLRTPVSSYYMRRRDMQRAYAGRFQAVPLVWLGREALIGIKSLRSPSSCIPIYPRLGIMRSREIHSLRITHRLSAV